MSRQLKPQIVDEVTSPNGLVRIPVYFDRNEKDFFVEITGRDDRVRADSVHEVKKLAAEMLAKAVEYKWEGIIVVEMEESYDEKYKAAGAYSYKGHAGFGARIEFEFDRLERSRHPTREGEFVYRKHTLDFEAGEPSTFSRTEREKNASVKTYCPFDATVLPYDDETWAGLLALKRAVDDAQAKLEDLVARKDFAERLRLVGKQAPMSFLLPAGGRR